jgi:hypothetical protein
MAGAGEFDVANAELFLAPYLTRERRAGFLEELKQFPPKRLYAAIDDPDPLQGDGWAGISVLRFHDGARDQIKAVVLSNSCDVAGGNARHLPSFLSFAPIINLAKYSEVVISAVGEAKAQDHLRDVREQKVSSIFYLPDTGELGGESIVMLDAIHSVPLSFFQQDQSVKRLFSLSDVGFWTFLFKLSFHFCRFHENVDRTNARQ